MRVERRGRLLVVRFPRRMRVLGWAVVGGGFRRAQTVVWFHVRHEELPLGNDPGYLLRKHLAAAHLAGAVGMMTGVNLDRYQDVKKSMGSLVVRCISTVGLSNALAVGDPPDTAEAPGTVNLLCHVSIALSLKAMVEAVSIAAEARTAAFLEHQIPSTCSGSPATGTGTDCIVVVSPSEGPAEGYSGKHTSVGSLIGQSVKDAVMKGIKRQRTASR